MNALMTPGAALELRSLPCFSARCSLQPWSCPTTNAPASLARYRSNPRRAHN